MKSIFYARKRLEADGDMAEEEKKLLDLVSKKWDLN